jgi:hypothetical protein
LRICMSSSMRCRSTVMDRLLDKMKSLHMQPLHLGKEDQQNWDTKNTLSPATGGAKLSDYREAV